jgi:hypothetical protein
MVEVKVKVMEDEMINCIFKTLLTKFKRIKPLKMNYTPRKDCKSNHFNLDI